MTTDYLKRNGAIFVGMRMAVVRGPNAEGYPVDLATIRFNRKTEKGESPVTVKAVWPNLVISEYKPNGAADGGIKDALAVLARERHLSDVKPLERSEIGNTLTAGKDGNFIIPDGRGFPHWLSGIVLSPDEWPIYVLNRERAAVPIFDDGGRLTAVEFRVYKSDRGQDNVTLPTLQ